MELCATFSESLVSTSNVSLNCTWIKRISLKVELTFAFDFACIAFDSDFIQGYSFTSCVCVYWAVKLIQLLVGEMLPWFCFFERWSYTLCVCVFLSYFLTFDFSCQRNKTPWNVKCLKFAHTRDIIKSGEYKSKLLLWHR